MITREEFNASIDSGFFDDAIEYVDRLEQHIKSLEAQLANTEQLTCDGCRWDAKVKHIQTHPHCLDCIRGEHGDFYEPKDTQ